jgi:hypothetical protein
VENIIGKLLEEISDLIDPDEKTRFVQALEQAKQTTVTKDRIALVKDLLPEILRPGGMNPLSVLHSVLSEGIHDLSDEECVEKAAAIREVLVFFGSSSVCNNGSFEELH